MKTQWLLFGAWLMTACSAESKSDPPAVASGATGTTAQGAGGTGGAAGSTTTAGGAGGGPLITVGGDGGPPVGMVVPGCVGACTDFPPDPIVDTGVPADTPGTFGRAMATTANGPCLTDPQSGTLFPSNWLRPRFTFTAPSGQTLFELRIHSDREKNDLVIYTKATTWTMPKEIWRALVSHVVAQPISVTVRGLEMAGGSPIAHASPTATFSVAPVDAPGTIVYWTTSGTSALKGFSPGDEDVTTVLTPAAVGTNVRCIGCHTSTPDGQFIGVATNAAVYNADPANLSIRSGGATGQEPPYLTPQARQLLQRPRQQMATFSPAHWKTGDRIAVSMFNNSSIIWTDLEAGSADAGVGWGTIARTGDTGLPIGAAWSHDGESIVYTSASGTVDTGIRALTGVGSLYVVPYGNRMGGAARPLAGVNDPKFHAYYPAFAPDDRLIAFTRASSAAATYDAPTAEIFVSPRDGAAMPTRLAANDPAACSGRTSPGLTNSWPKWAPAVRTVDGRSYYWLTFSSKRMSGGMPQIFITAVVTKDGAPIETYPALHVWNQPNTEANHTPAWDMFEIVVR